MTTLEKAKHQTATSFTARQINRRVILNVIQQHQPVSRADAARHTGLQRSTVSLIVDDLIKEGWVVEGELGRIPRGRRPTYLQINSEGARLLGIHLDTDALRVSLANLNGEIHWNTKVELKDLTIEALRSAFHELKAMLLPVLGELELKGIGIACADCQLDPSDISKACEDVFECCAVADSIAVACGEWFLLHSKDDSKDHLVSIFADDCIELGVLVNGEPFRGANGRAGRLIPAAFSNDHGTKLEDYIEFAVAAYDPALILITGKQVADEESVRPALEQKLKNLGASKVVLQLVSNHKDANASHHQIFNKSSVALILNHYLGECEI